MTQPQATYTYDPTLSDVVSQIRQLVHDIPQNNSAELSDQAITFWYNQEGKRLYDGAAAVAEAIGAKYSALQDKYIGPLRITYGTTAERFKNLADSLRNRKYQRTGFAVQLTAPPREAPVFQLGMHDNNDDTSLAGTSIDPATAGDFE